ncbi:uncharacterized protein K02A2.6 [Anopheles stephensi]|uniref:uncharacterized protein K02A2.6 n=1 Tax=Anopheles stephensi TaxID=30069 RepID=UPI001658914B|nr:uncharacterized protein K02A2.6 [Anopheles stephensi]
MFSPDDTTGMDDQRRLSQNGANALNAAFVPRQHPPSQSTGTLTVHPPSQHPAAAAQSGTATQGPDTAMLYQMLQLMQQQMQQQQQQQQMMAQMMQQQQHTAPQPQYQPQQQPAAPRDPEIIMDALSASITEFRYEAESGLTFNAWYKRYEDVFAQDASRLEDSAKVRLMMRKLGTIEHARYSNYILPQLPRDISFNETVSKLKTLFGLTESLLSKRYRCLKIVKARNEDLLTFSSRVNRACDDFQFASMNEAQFKCLILICGLRDDADAEIRMRLLTIIEGKSEITLEQLSTEGQRILGLKVDSALISAEGVDRVLALHNEEKRRFPATNRPNYTHQRQTQPRNVESAPVSKPRRPCWLCGEYHWVRECTYGSHKCQDCGRHGHREGYCRTSGPRRERGSRFRKRSAVAIRVVTVNVGNVQQKRKYVITQIGTRTIELQLDTGSDITIIGRETWKQLGMPTLSSAKVHAKTASGTRLQLDGEFKSHVTIHGRTEVATIRVVPSDLHLLGADIIDLFQLGQMPLDVLCSKVECESATWENRFPAVFNGTGLCTKANIKLHLKPNVRPTFCPKRPVAYAMQATVEKELNRLEQLKVITPVDYSEWAAPIVVVRKSNGSIRICGDYSTGLNSALRSHEYPLPLPDDIFSKLAQSRYFSKIDLSDAFLQVEIDAKYRPLLTINTHRGLYHYNRLPPGIKIAPAAFQQLIDTMLAGLKGTSGYMDDVIVGGKTEREHDENLLNLFRRIQQYGFTIRAEKCAFKMEQIEYLGFIIDRRGLRPNPAKIEVIRKLPAPRNVSEVRSFLGAINYYGRFVPRMRDLRYPLDALLKHEDKFAWTPECERAFTRFKDMLSSELLLTHTIRTPK